MTELRTPIFTDLGWVFAVFAVSLIVFHLLFVWPRNLPKLEVNFEQERAEYVPERMIFQQWRGVPEDIAGLVVYLASESSSLLMGQTVFVEGGMLSHM